MEHLTQAQFDTFVRELQLIARGAGDEIKITAAQYPEDHPQAGKEYMIGYSVMLRGHREVLAAVHYPYTKAALYTVWRFQAGLYLATLQQERKRA